MSQSELRKIPGVDTLFDELSFEPSLPDPLIKRVIRSELSELRDDIQNGADCPPTDRIHERVLRRCRTLNDNRIRTVINATGVVLHTNLGRAPYPSDAVEDSAAVTEGYSNLEMDLSRGGRGGRGRYAEQLLCELTGAESAAVVNNCSSALVLTLKTLADEREVLISRGELVQIGGGFRIPEILEVSGARLREVGTTNRTEFSDYEEGLRDETGLILQVHRSNFDQVGFTGAPGTAELRDLAEEAGVPLVCDLGSGALVDTADYGLKHERQPGEVLEAGADLVMFSGDKLLGGPQAGLVVGDETMVSKLKNHPLFRALRVDKSILTVLESILTLYATGQADQMPVYRMFSTPAEQLRSRAREIVASLDDDHRLSVVDMEGTVGGGALPTETIPSAGVAIEADDPKRCKDRLRNGSPPVIGRVKEDRVHLNFRTIPPERDSDLVEVLADTLENS